MANMENDYNLLRGHTVSNSVIHHNFQKQTNDIRPGNFICSHSALTFQAGVPGHCEQLKDGPIKLWPAIDQGLLMSTMKAAGDQAGPQ